MAVGNDQESPDHAGAQLPEPAIVRNEVVAGVVNGVVVQAQTITGGVQVPLPPQAAGPHSPRPRVSLVVPSLALMMATIGIVAFLSHRPPPEDQVQPPAATSSPPSVSSSGEAAATPSPTAPVTSTAPAATRVVAPTPVGTPAAEPPQPVDPRPAAFSQGADVRLRNASTQECVSGDAFYPGSETCGAADSHVWTLRASSGDTFALVNRASGKCLEAPGVRDGSVGLAACSGLGGTGYTYWRIGSTTSTGRTLQNTHTGQCLRIGSPPLGGPRQPMVATCDSGRPEQLWTSG